MPEKDKIHKSILFKKQLYEKLYKTKIVTKSKDPRAKLKKAILSLVGKFTTSEDTCISEVITHEREMEGSTGYIVCPHRNYTLNELYRLHSLLVAAMPRVSARWKLFAGFLFLWTLVRVGLKCGRKVKFGVKMFQFDCIKKFYKKICSKLVI